MIKQISLIFYCGIITNAMQAMQTPLLDWMLKKMDNDAQIVRSYKVTDIKRKEDQEYILQKMTQVKNCIEKVKEVQQADMSEMQSDEKNEKYYNLAKDSCTNPTLKRDLDNRLAMIQGSAAVNEFYKTREQLEN